MFFYGLWIDIIQSYVVIFSISVKASIIKNFYYCLEILKNILELFSIKVDEIH
ncbi:hypothetical protein EC846_3310 [Acinetobacter sp. BIGb0102]|nr:hypothetical protein EC846_3310 [Acinetobacter sp. BIGb0102]